MTSMFLPSIRQNFDATKDIVASVSWLLDTFSKLSIF